MVIKSTLIKFPYQTQPSPTVRVFSIPHFTTEENIFILSSSIY